MDYSASPYCIPCEGRDNWIELYVVDENNNPIKGIEGTLIDACETPIKFTLSGKPVLITGLTVGHIKSLYFKTDRWVSEVQRRPLKEDEANGKKELPVTGYKETRFEKKDCTTGEFLDQSSDEDKHVHNSLPPKHKEKLIDVLTSNHSYILKVRSWTSVSVRFGIFFDGTNNNTFSSQWAKPFLERYRGTWQTSFKKYLQRSSGGLIEKMAEMPDSLVKMTSCNEKIKDSAENEPTNVWKLHELYRFNSVPGQILAKSYITGCGTENNTEPAPPQESFWNWSAGAGLGMGDLGVLEKAALGLENVYAMLAQGISDYIDDNKLPDADCIDKIEIDVFGFSRGAATARHFIHQVLSGKDSPFAKRVEQICREEEAPLVHRFAWDKKKYCSIGFAGLFDTVAAVGLPDNNDNGKVQLCLDKKQVSYAVHYTAHKKTEFRTNFRLNKLNNVGGNFVEYIFPGAHSDLGGGYHSAESFHWGGPEPLKNENIFFLPLMESKCIYSIRSLTSYRRDEDLEREKKKMQRQLAGKKAELMQTLNIPVREDSLSLRITEHFESGNKNNSTSLRGRIYIQCPVDSVLSRIFLRLMYVQAFNVGVPFDIKKAKASFNDDQYYKIDVMKEAPLVMDTYPDYTIGLLGKEILAAQLEQPDSDLQPEQFKKITTLMENVEFRKAVLATKIVHHSADTSIANRPSDNNIRVEYECSKHEVLPDHYCYIDGEGEDDNIV